MRYSNCVNNDEDKKKCDCKNNKKHECHKQKKPKELELSSEQIERMAKLEINGECNCECDNPDCKPDPDPDMDKNVIFEIEVNQHQNLSEDNINDKLKDMNKD